MEQGSSWLKKNQNKREEKIEIHLKQAILTDDTLKNIFFFKENIISLQKVEVLSNLGSFPKNGSCFRVILAEKLSFCIEEKKELLPEGSSQASPEEKLLSLEDANVQIRVGLDEFREFLPSGF